MTCHMVRRGALLRRSTSDFRQKLFQIPGLLLLLTLFCLQGSPNALAQTAAQPSLEWELEVGGGHRGGINRVVVASDGLTAFSVGQDGALKRWDLITGQLLSSWEGSASSLTALDMSPDGRLLGVGGNDGSIQVRSVETGRIIQTIRAHDSEVTSISFSSDGRQLVSAGNDARVHIWLPMTGREFKTFTGVNRNLSSVQFAPDGKTVYAAGAEGKIFRWSLATSKPMRPLETGDSAVTSLDISSNGRYLVSGHWDQQARLWDLRNDKVVRTFAYHRNWVTDVAFSPDGQFIVTAGRDRELAFWNLKNPKPLAIWKGHAGMVSSVSFAANGESVLSSSWDGTLRQWSTGLPGNPELGGQLMMVVRGGSIQVTSAAWSADGRRLAIGYPDGTAYVWDVSNGSVVQTLRAGWTAVRALAWSSSGALAMGMDDGTVLLWTLEGTLRRKSLTGHTGQILSVAFSSDGQRLATASLDRTVQIWNTQIPELVRSLPFKAEPGALTFSPDGRGVIVGTESGELGWYNVETGTADKPFVAKGAAVRHLSLAKSGRQLVAGLASGGIALFNLEDRKQLQTYLGHSGPVNAVSLSPDGRRMVSIGRDLTLRWWDLSKPDSEVKRLNMVMNDVLWSPDGSAVALASDGLKLFHPTRQEELSTLHRLGELTVRTTPQGIFSGPEVVMKQVFYRRFERIRPATESAMCYLSEGFQPLVPPSRTPACNAQLNGKPVDRLDELNAPGPAPVLIRLVPVGIGEFANNTPARPLNLKYGAKDVKRVVDQLKRVYGNALVVEGGAPLLDELATRENILARLESAMQASNGKPNELVLVYVVSRGGNDGAEFTLFPYDYDPESPLLSSISQTRVMDILSRYDARVLLVMDAGQPPPVQPPAEAREIGLARLAISRQKTWILLSARGEETFEDRRFCRWGGGAFSCAWMEAMRGRADAAASVTGEGDGVLTVDELYKYLQREVADIVKRKGPERAAQQPLLLRYGGKLTLHRRQ